jgi:hypothetical protein
MNLNENLFRAGIWHWDFLQGEVGGGTERVETKRFHEDPSDDGGMRSGGPIRFLLKGNEAMDVAKRVGPAVELSQC